MIIMPGDLLLNDFMAIGYTEQRGLEVEWPNTQEDRVEMKAFGLVTALAITRQSIIAGRTVWMVYVLCSTTNQLAWVWSNWLMTLDNQVII